MTRATLRWRLIAGTVAVSLILAACSGQQASPAQPSILPTGGPTEAATAAPTAAPISISFWHVPWYINVPGYETANYGDWEKHLASEFTKSHPNVTIDVQVVDWGEVAAKVTTAVQAGTTPDIYFDDSLRQNTWAAEPGLIENIRDLVPPEVLGRILPAYLDAVNVNDVITTLPTRVDAYGMMECNKALLDEAGVQLPVDGVWSVSEFEAAMSKVAQPGQRWPLVVRLADEQGDYDWLGFFFSFGARPFNAELTQSTLGSPEGTAALEWLVELNDRGWVLPGTTTIAFGDVDTAFYTGKLVCRGGRPNHLALAENAKAEGKITGPFESAIVLYPHADDKPPVGGWVFVSGLQVFKQTDDAKREAIGDFLAFVASKESMAAQAKTGHISPYTDVGNPLTSDPLLGTALDKSADWIGKHGVADQGFKTPRFYPCRLARIPYIQQALLGQLTPEAALTALDRQCDEILKAL